MLGDLSLVAIKYCRQDSGFGLNSHLNFVFGENVGLDATFPLVVSLCDSMVNWWFTNNIQIEFKLLI